jgi:hypothetical protein
MFSFDYRRQRATGAAPQDFNPGAYDRLTPA